MSKLHSAKAVLASSKGARRLKRSAWLLSAAVAAITLANPAHAQLASNALPTGGDVVAGSATIGTPTPSSMTITQSTDRAVINWNSFDIGSSASVAFNQPSTTSITVNRVISGANPSEIAGQLTANGRVAILNPNGVLFSGTANVNVGSLIASTGDIDQGAFMAGGNLDITGATGGSIVVNGNINISAGSLGLAAFVAPTVRNSGVITATAGRVQLGGGTAFTLDLAGDGLLSVGVPATSALVQNSGQIFAEGGRIQMTAKSASGLVDNLVNTGTLSVDSATLDNGTIVLQAIGGTANLSGTVAANDRNSISQNILISSDRGVNISGNLSGASGTVNITAPHIWGAGKISTATALKLNISNDGSDTTALGNYINDALGVIGTTGFGTTLRLGAGTYRSGVVINANDVRIDGQGVAKIGWTSGIENAIDIWGDYVTIQNLEIAGPATSAFTSYAWGSTNSRGIFVNRYADGVQLLNNNIHDIRTGIIVDGRNANTYLLDNTIDNTKSAISIQYTDGSNVVMTGNHGSTYGNEWGINLYLNGILQADGVTILPAAGSLGANTPLAEQQRLLALRAANGGMEVQNQGYSALNRTAAYVSTTGSNSNQGSPLGTLATIQAGVNAVVTGGTVYVANGNYNLGSSQLVINHALSLVGASQAGVVIDGRAVSANGLGTISVIADNVSLSNFSLLGSQLSGGNYGIKVQPNPAGHVNTAGGDSQRVSNFAISNVTVSGSRRAELDLNGVVGATITNLTADGQGTDGAGVQITDSANVTLSGVHTLNNNWGGVALYQSNSASAYNAQTTNITIDAGQNSFDEANGLFTQDSSATQNFGTLNLTGFNYAIRNTGSRADASQFTWFQTSLGNATAFALGLGAATTSSIEGWNVSAGTNQFTVVAGMGVDAAVRDARAGATINVGIGTFTFSNTLMIDKSLSLIGASESGTIFDASALGVYGMRVHADNVALSGFTLLAPSAVSSSTYGIKVEVGAGDVNGNARIDNFAIRDVTISGSRKTGLDLNSVIGATLDNVNVTGALAGNGISITDSANVTVRNTTTSGNAWGGLALYQANGATGSNQQLTGITIEGNNSFGESNGLYLQDSSATNDVGALSIAGFDYIVRNTGFRADGNQFTFFRTSLADATGYALSLANAATGSVEGWNGSAGTNSFTVVSGLGIGAAVRDARAGASINVGAGTYVENVLINKAGISLIGAGRDVTTITGISGVGALGSVTLAAGSNNTLLRGFTINGIENGNPGSETAAVYLQQTNTGSQIRDNRIVAAGDLGLVSEWGYAITGLVVDGNIIGGKTYVGATPATGDQFTVPNVSRQLVALGGGGVGGGISFTNNVVNGDSGLNTGVTIDSAGSTITGNSFATTTGGFGAMLRVRGANAAITGNSFDMAGVAYTANGLYVSDPAIAGTSFADVLAANTLIGAGAWADSSVSGYHSFSRNIQGAVNEAAPGAVVTIRPGQYLEGVTGVGYYGDAGAQSFGLYLYKDNITLRGVDAAGNAITDADDVVAFITSRYQAGFGAQHFISGNGVTIEGLGFLPAAAGDNKTVEVIGNAFTLRNSVIDNRGNQTAANLYIDDFNDPSRTRLESFTITGNNFYGGTYASAMVVVAGGAGRTTDASNRIFSDNYLYSDLSGMRGFQIQGYMPNTPWQQLYAGAVTVSGNRFDVDIPVRTVGLLSSAFAWDDVFRNNGNSFLRGGVLTYAGGTNTARATITAGGDPDIRITSTIDASLARAQAGDTVRILDGTYVIGSQLAITTSVSLVGQSQTGTIIDGRTVNNGGGLGTILVAADNTTLSNFTLLGSTLSGGNYGIKVQPNPLGYTPTGGADQRINNITISDVTVRGSRRAELDINGAIGVTLTNFTADGAGTDGAGVQITDSANVTLTGVHTLGNNWGGVALYQTNRAGGYNGQTTNINIDAGQNDFDEANGLFAQLESTTQGFGQLNLTGYGYAVRNTGSRADGYQFTYFRTDLADATGWALGLGGASTSSIEGYTGTGYSNVFTVVSGLSIAAAARDVRANGTINVGAGTYASGTVIGTNGVSLLGASGAKIDASHDGDNGITITGDGVTVSGFEIFGPANQSFVSYAWPTTTRGIVVANGADNATVTGNNIHDVRNGILIDGRNASTALTNNVIDNTKSAISVQYTDGANLTISGNSEGAFGNEWGIITYLNGIWNGTTITASAGALGPNTPLSEQQRLLALAAANNGMAVYNQGYSAANRTRAYVTTAGVAGAQGSQRTLLNLQGGLDAVVAGGTVYIAGGTYAENVSLDALRVLDIAGPITVNSLSFGAGAAGTNIGTSLTATGALSFAIGPVLTGNTVLTANSIAIGAISSAYGLTLNGTGSVSIGLADLASLVANGGSIVTGGVTTSGAQSYTGATTFAGTYSTGGASLTVTGASTLAGATSIATNGGGTTLGTVTGNGNSLAITAGTGSVALGAATGLSSLSASGASIATAGATSTGAQSYTGATTLGGTYSAAAFTVTGATTLGGTTSIGTTGGNVTLGAIGATGTGNGLTVNAGTGAVALGAATGLGSLSVTGATITTAGAATSGTQTFAGATTLNGSYTAGGNFTVNGAATLGGNATVTAGGNASFGAVGGANSLAVTATNNVTLGAVTGLTGLSASGATIATSGATTTGAQSYTGATTLRGGYTTGGTAFTVNGATTLGANTTIGSAGGAVTLGTINGGTLSSLGVTAGAGTVNLGAATGLTQLNVNAASIVTAGAGTSGIQSYVGATRLNGVYASGGALNVIGTATVTGNTALLAQNVSMGGVIGTGNLSINAGGGTVSLGGVNGLASLGITASSITSNGAITNGAQSYTAATTRLAGNYVTNGGSFAVNGQATVPNAVNVVTGGGSATIGGISGAGSLAVNAGTGNVTLGAATGLATLSATGATIATGGAATSGAQTYTGATSLGGTYTAGGAFTVNGTTSVSGNTSVAAGGNASFGAVGGTGSLAVNAGSNGVTLGAVSGLTSLSATGATIATAGVTTSGSQSYTGATSLNGAYTAGTGFTVNGAATLGGDTNVTAGGNASLGATSGAHALTVDATGTVTLGAVDTASLSASGTSIATAGATTTGAQSYTGATSLNGSYTAGTGFALNGAATLGGDTNVSSGGNASLGATSGAHALAVDATGTVTLGAVDTASLSASGTSIVTAGAVTTGAQSYTGATSLGGTYTAGAGFTVNGPATLAADTNVTAGGDAGFGTVGGAHGLSVNAANVTLGAVSGLTSLSATGATIATSGAATSGAQSYSGATSLNGAYTTNGGAFTVTGAATTVNAVSVTTAGGNTGFGTVGGAGGLTVNAGTGSVTLGSVSGIASLSATGATIATSGASTTGAQSYTGATSLNGAYTTNGGSFAVNGAATTVNAVSVATSGGNAGFGTVGGAGGLTVNAGTGNVTLGAVSGIASLSATGATIATAGASTSGAQAYTGATTLGGSYAASSLAVNGATTLSGATSVTTSGNASFGAVSGTGNFTVNAGAGSVSLGAVSGVGTLAVTGATIATSGAATSGTQSYTGATSLSGAYTGTGFTVTGATNLTGTTSVATGNGAIALGAVDAAVAGNQGLTLNAGTGSVALGNLGAVRRLGATAVNGGATVLNGATYAANSLSFTGGTGSTVRLTQGTTTFNTTLPGGAGGAIAIQPDLVGTANAQQNVAFTAGNGLTVNSGDVTIGNAGTDAIRLGTLTVLGHNFSAATVKLASTFTSVLSGSQVFSANTLDTLGNVNATVAGFESGPIRAGGSVTIDAGGSGSGSIIAGGAVNVQYDASVSRTITSQSNVTIASLGAIGGSVTSGGTVNLQTTTGAITGAVNATGPVNASSTSGAITAAITSNGAVNLGSTSGTIGGSINAGGPVAITTTNGGVTSSVTTPGTASITSQSGTVNANVTGNGGVTVNTNGAITGTYGSTTAIDLTSSRPVNVQVNGSVVTVTAPSGTVTGVFGEIHTTNTGTLVVNDQPVIGSGTTDARQIIIDTFIIPTRGTVSANGEIQLPAGLALGLIAPAGNGQGGQRPAVVVNSVQRLGELLRLGYTAIIIQLDETNLDLEEEVAGQ